MRSISFLSVIFTTVSLVAAAHGYGVPVADEHVKEELTKYCEKYYRSTKRSCRKQGQRFLIETRDFLVKRFHYKEDADKLYESCVQQHIVNKKRADFRLIRHCVQTGVSRVKGVKAKRRPKCGEKYVCEQMDSREEAEYYFWQCGVTDLDGDYDGLPCEWQFY